MPPQTTPQRGDIFWADLATGVGSEQQGRRPVLVISATLINAKYPIVVCVPLTSRLQKVNRYFRIHIPEAEIVQEPGTMGHKEGIALTEQIRVISKDRLDNIRVARLTPAAIASVEAGIAYVLDLPP